MTALTITFETDWHVGTGAGVPGDLDAIVRRDRDDLPVVPAPTVTGMWRDGCERVAATLGGDWPAWLEVLFGRGPDRSAGTARLQPVAAALSVRTAVLADGLRARLRQEPLAARALFGARSGVKIDRGTGQAVPDMLRMIEVTRSGLVLHAPFELDDEGWDADQRRTAGVLLALGAEQVRALGGDRRRGLGACVWSLPEQPAVALALTGATPPTPAALPVRRGPATVTVPAGQAAETVVLELVARCVDPVVSTTIATDAIVRGQAIVPGGRVLPGVVARARVAGIEVEHLIAAGGLACGPLVPEINGTAARPAPLVFATPKGQTSPIYNRLRAPVPSDVTPRPLRDRWVGVGPAGPVIATAPTEIRAHNTVEDATQRPTSEVGGLYTYESIPAGTRLRGRVEITMAASDAAALAAALSGTWRLGLARKDEYGRVEITAGVVPTDAPPAPAEKASVTLWFLTDTILLDTRLAPVASVGGVLDALGGLVGEPVELATTEAGLPTHAMVFGRVDSWQTRWTRPRPTLPTVAAGSVIEIRRVDGKLIGADALARLAGGVGERQAEGYGRVALDDPLLEVTEVAATKAEPHAGPPSAATTEPDDGGLFDELLLSGRRTLIEEAAAAVPRDAWESLTTEPRASVRATLSVSKDPVSPDADAVWTVLKIPTAHRDPRLVTYARDRVLAHLTAGGAAAEPGADQEGDRHGS